MVAKAEVTVGLKVTELEVEDTDFIKRFTITATPARIIKHYMVQASADTEEAIVVGDVGTIELVVMKCVANDVDVDTSFDTTFSSEVKIQEGEFAVFKPTGTVYIKNEDAAEQCTIEYWVIGTA
jgi:hypothetical protein